MMIHSLPFGLKTHCAAQTSGCLKRKDSFLFPISKLRFIAAISDFSDEFIFSTLALENNRFWPLRHCVVALRGARGESFGRETPACSLAWLALKLAFKLV